MNRKSRHNANRNLTERSLKNILLGLKKASGIQPGLHYGNPRYLLHNWPGALASHISNRQKVLLKIIQ